MAKTLSKQDINKLGWGDCPTPPAFVASDFDYISFVTKFGGWVSANVMGDTKKEWVMDWLKTKKRDATGLGKVASCWFSRAANLTRLDAIGFPLSDRHLAMLEEEIETLYKRIEKDSVPINVTPSVTHLTEDPMLSHVDAIIDAFLKGSKPIPLSVPTNTSVTKINDMIDYVTDIKHQFLTQEESWRSASKITAIGKALDSLIAQLNDSITSIKTAKAAAKLRKPRKAKAPTPIKHNIELMTSSDKFGFVTKPVDAVIGKKECFILDATYNILTHITALESSTLSLKGSSVINTLEAKQKRINPKKHKETIAKMTRSLNPLSLYNSIEVEETPGNTRLNVNKMLICAR